MKKSLLSASALVNLPSAKRGFGLIDVSLGIIAGIGLLVGAVILFQQVTTNNTVSELTRNAVTISSEVRTAARALPSFSALDADAEVTDGVYGTGEVETEALGLEPGMVTGVTIDTSGGANDQFTLNFADLNERACNRAALTPANLGANVVSATCTVTSGVGALAVVYSR